MTSDLDKCIGKTLKSYKLTDDADDFRVYLEWSDGTWTEIAAEYESDWSDVTPGMGFMASICSGPTK